jgi:hypothetical protein
MEAEYLLVRCPKCGRWPMAAHRARPWSPNRMIKFVCICGYTESWEPNERNGFSVISKGP